MIRSAKQGTRRSTTNKGLGSRVSVFDRTLETLCPIFSSRTFFQLKLKSSLQSRLEEYSSASYKNPPWLPKNPPETTNQPNPLRSPAGTAGLSFLLITPQRPTSPFLLVTVSPRSFLDSFSFLAFASILTIASFFFSLFFSSLLSASQAPRPSWLIYRAARSSRSSTRTSS